MTAVLSERTVEAYPPGWSFDYAHMGREWNCTAYVGFSNSPEEKVRAIAAHAETVTGHPMTVFRDRDGDWSYRPLASLAGAA